ncbi:MAG: MFS transporter [Gammaproteobacteria bacterium]
MNQLERRTALAVTVVFGLRMLGLFSLMPVLSVLASDLSGANVFLAGLSVGVYGLTQSMLQIPMGWLSDRWGRKPVILLGLLIFAMGSIVAALSDSIWGVVLGRALQGAGAIASALLALVTDAARPEYRTRLMAMVGASIGLAFTLAFVLGPKLGVWLGLSGLFYFSCGCAVLAALVVGFGLPVLPPVPVTPTSFSHSVKQIVQNADLVRLDVSVFILHTLMTALFVMLPLMLTKASLGLSTHTNFYLPCVLIAFLLMAPAVYWSEKRKRLKPLLNGAVLVMGLSLCVLAAAAEASWVIIAIGFTFFFTGFNIMEASLPSAVGKTAPSDLRGVAMGVFSSAQFLGAFSGGVLAGGLLELLPPQYAVYSERGR